MKPDKTIAHEFVEQMPADLRPDRLYISIRYRTTAHLCMCGCGEKVVNPIRPNRWSLTFDGKSVSLNPSVGNSGLPCNSHYWIEGGWVRMLAPMTYEQTTKAKGRDGWTTIDSSEPTELVQVDEVQTPERGTVRGWLARLIRRQR